VIRINQIHIERIKSLHAVIHTGTAKCCVMVLTDDLDMRSMLRTRLEEAGYEVNEAQDGDEAVATFRKRPSQVFLVDVVWSKGTLVRLLFDLRTQFPDASIIVMLQGQWISEHRFVAKSFGVQQFLCTPFSQHELVRTIQTALSVAGNGQISGE
jgi:DNA-binding response OmpR family regulator